MAIIDFHILAQGLIYFCMSVAGLVVSITVGVNRSNFQGVCILYGRTEWNDNEFVVRQSDESNCNFPIYFSVFGLILYGLLMGIYYIYAVLKSRTDPTIGTQMWVMPFLLVNVVLAFITLIVACMLSVGFKDFCDGYEDNDQKKVKCSDGEKIEWKNLSNGKMYKPGPYTVFMSVAMAAAWLCLLIEFIQIGLGILRFIRNRRQRGSTGDKSTSDTKKIGNVEPTA